MVVDRGVSWETAVQVYEQHLSDHGASESSTAGRGQSGFYCSRREQYHRHLYILALQKENSTHLFNIIRFINPRSACVTVTVVLLSVALSARGATIMHQTRHTDDFRSLESHKILHLCIRFAVSKVLLYAA